MNPIKSRSSRCALPTDEPESDRTGAGVELPTLALALPPPPPPPPQYAAPAPAPAQEDLTAKLQQLATLHSQGVLSDEEFAAAKQKLLAG